MSELYQTKEWGLPVAERPYILPATEGYFPGISQKISLS